MRLNTSNNLEILLFDHNIEIIETNDINGIKKINTIDIYAEDIRIIIDALLKIENDYKYQNRHVGQMKDSTQEEICPDCAGAGLIMEGHFPPHYKRCITCKCTGKVQTLQKGGGSDEEGL